MELLRYLQLLRQRLALVLLTMVAGLAGGYLVTGHSPMYVAQTSIYVGSRQPSTNSATDVLQLDRIIATYAAMVKSTPVALGAIQAAHVPRDPGQVVAHTSSVVVPNTNLISVSVADRNPGVAQALANGLAASFKSQVDALSQTTGADASTPGTATPSAPSVSVFQQASLPGASVSTGLKRDLALGALFGLVVSVGLVLLVDYLDTSVKSADDVERASNLPVLGAIPLVRAESAGPLPMTS
jgi:capsular polysaccharide biosynthesis protein